MRNLLYIWYDELTTVLRDKGIMIFIAFVPLFYPLLYSYVYTNEVVRNVPAVVVDESHSFLSRKFIQEVDGTPDVEIVARCHSVSEAREYVRAHQAYGIIRIPNTLNRDLLHGDQTYIGLYCDMSSMLYYKALLLACTDVSLDINNHIKVDRLGATTIRDEEITKMPIDYEHLALFNPQSGFASFLIPPVLMLIIQQTLLLGIGMEMGSTREKYQGCVIPFDKHYKHVLPIIGGKALFYLMFYFVMAIYMFTFVNHSFGLPQLGHYWTLLAFIIPYILSCIFFAITLSSLIYRREDCILIFVFMSVPMVFLSGVSWPSSAMPVGWKLFSYMFPSSLGMNAYVRIMSMECNLQDILPLYLGIWAQVVIYFLTSCAMYLKHIRRMKLNLTP
jgi:ABC-2 type transport system permease protein